MNKTALKSAAVGFVALVGIGTAVLYVKNQPATRSLSAAATIWQTDGSAADVQAKINSAVNGDTVMVPAGTFTWATAVTNAKSVTLKGAGIGLTIVRDNKDSGTLVTLNYSNLPNGRPRMTGIEFVDGGRATQEPVPVAIIKIIGSNTNGGAARIDHCKFYHLNGHTIGTDTAIGTVIDHCDIIMWKNTYCWVMAESYDGGEWGDRSWMKPANFGTNDFVFIEDCLLQNDTQFFASVDCFGGGRYVERYCRWVNTHPGGHGTEGQRRRGIRAAEIYNNVGEHTEGGIIGNCRGGSQMYHDNTITGVSTHGIRLQCQRYNGPMGPWGHANGTNQYDKNSNGQLVLAIDQCGAGKGGQLSGGVPPVIPAGWNDQEIDPCYDWNNTFNGQPTHMYGEQPNIQENIHYFKSPKPGYIPYTYPHPLVGGGPPSPTPTVAPTATPSVTATSTPTVTATFTPTPTPSATFTPTPSATFTPTPTPPVEITALTCNNGQPFTEGTILTQNENYTVVAAASGLTQSVTFARDGSVIKTDNASPYDHTFTPIAAGPHEYVVTPWTQDAAQGTSGLPITLTYEVVTPTPTPTATATYTPTPTPSATYTPTPTPAGPTITSFTVDGVPFVEGMDITANVSHTWAATGNSVTQSVVFIRDAGTTKTDSAEPYNWTFTPTSVGAHDMAVTPWSQDNGAGISGLPITVNYDVVP